MTERKSKKDNQRSTKHTYLLFQFIMQCEPMIFFKLFLTLVGPYMILEYCEEGNLRDWLLRNNDRVGDEVVERLYQIILGVSNGMKYLSSKKVLMLYHLMNVSKLCIRLFSILNNKCLSCYFIIEYQYSYKRVRSFFLVSLYIYCYV
jgi:serine/threonine protein kinase